MDFVIDDLTTDDLSRIGWSGGRVHLENVTQQLARRAAGEAEYLAVRTPEGEPVAKGGIDYAAHQGAGTIWQLVTREDLRSRGLGTALIAEAERRIAARGVKHAVIGVEEHNTGALALYRRLGYEDWSSEETGWDQEDDNGQVSRYETTCLLLRKQL